MTVSTRHIIVAILAVLVVLLFAFFTGSESGERSESAPATTTQSSSTLDKDKQAVSTRRRALEVATSTQQGDQYNITTEQLRGTTTIARQAREFIRTRQVEFTRFIADNTSDPNDRSQPTFTFSAQMDVYQTDRYVSLVYTITEYTGGVNENTSVHTFVEDKRDGQLVGLSDVIPASKRTNFMTTLRDNLQEQTGTSIFRDAVSALTFADLENFYITSGDITVMFAPYEIAPGAAGVVSASVPR